MGIRAVIMIFRDQESVRDSEFDHWQFRGRGPLVKAFPVKPVEGAGMVGAGR